MTSARASVATGRAVRARVWTALPWDVVQLSVGASLLTVVWRVQDLFPILAKIQAPTLAAVASLLSYVLNADPRRKAKATRHVITTLVAALFVWAVASIPGSVYPGYSFKFVFNDFIKTLLMAFIIAGSVRTSDDVDRYIRVHVIGAFVYSVYVTLKVQVGSDGRLGELFYYDANGLALLLAATLPLMIYYTRSQEPMLWRLGAVAGCGVSVLTLMKSGSRGGFLALLGSGAYLLFGFRAIPRRIRIGAVAGVTVMLLIVGSDKYWQMMGTLLHPTSDYNWSGKDETGRMEVWKRGIGYMMDRPILGVGADAFPIAEGTISALAQRQELGIGLKWSAAHNSFVQIGAELGIPGLVVFVLMLFQAFRTLARIAGAATAATGEGARDAALAQVLIASLIAYCIAGFFLSEAFSPFLFSLLGLVVGLSKVTRQAAPVTAATPGRARPSAGWRAYRPLPPSPSP